MAECHKLLKFEEQQIQAKPGNRLSGIRVGNPTKTMGSNDETCGEVRQQQRLPDQPPRHSHHPGGNDAQSDIDDQLVFHRVRGIRAHGRLPVRPRI